MNRRSFAQSLGTAALLSGMAEADAARKTAIYRLDYLYCRQGSQPGRIQEFLSSQMSLLEKSALAVGVFSMVIGRHLPAVVVLQGFGGLEEMEAADTRLRRNNAYRSALAKLEQGAEPPYDRTDRVLLRATEFSPASVLQPQEKPAKPRIFELRVYHSPTERQLHFLQERFAGPEIGIFHRSGVHPILYADTLAGTNLPNLTYLIPFADLAARDKAWDAFSADPDWVKARADSVARGGQIVAESEVTLLRAEPYSPIQ